MFTSIDKNLLIAAMESAIFHACRNANIVSLHAIETGVSYLRQKFDTDPASVTDDEIFAYIEIIENARIPAASQINLTEQNIDISNSIVSFLWKNIVGRPATFPPATHAHTWSDVTYKPATFPPSDHTHPAQIVGWNDVTEKPTTFEPATHAHDYASITDKPTTFEPATHAHDYASITDKPTTFEPATHAHDYASITDKPTTFEPAAHAHDYASITDKPTTFEPAAHGHVTAEITDFPANLKAIAKVFWLGNGAPNRVISLPFTLSVGELISQTGFFGRIVESGMLYKSGGTFESGVFTFAGNDMTISNIAYNSNGIYFNLLLIGG